MDNLAKPLARWIAGGHARATGKKCQPADMEGIAKRILERGHKTGSVEYLRQGDRVIALLVLSRSGQPRIRGERNLFFDYEKASRARALRWVAQQLRGMEIPRHTSIGLAASEDKYFRKLLVRSGFDLRYEILRGEVKPALRALGRIKNPLRDLRHLGLELRAIRKSRELQQVMDLQRRVSLRDRRHSYYSHTAAQLRRDEQEYRQHLARGTALILGVYEKGILMGVMIATINKAPGGLKNGGLTFFLHRRVQGKGIVKTGYLLLLEYLVRKNVKKFYGGTSQPAVQGLGKVMGRKMVSALYLKTSE